MIAVGVAEGEDWPPSDEMVDGDRIAGPVIDLGSFIRRGFPSAPILNSVTPDEPTTCSGGMP
jgi:hypothetical protein